MCCQPVEERNKARGIYIVLMRPFSKASCDIVINPHTLWAQEEKENTVLNSVCTYTLLPCVCLLVITPSIVPSKSLIIKHIDLMYVQQPISIVLSCG